MLRNLKELVFSIPLSVWKYTGLISNYKIHVILNEYYKFFLKYLISEDMYKYQSHVKYYNWLFLRGNFIYVYKIFKLKEFKGCYFDHKKLPNLPVWFENLK